MGFTHQEYGINHVRLCKDRIDLGDESQCEQLDYLSPSRKGCTSTYVGLYPLHIRIPLAVHQ